jgi:hypothetical protein
MIVPRQRHPFDCQAWAAEFSAPAREMPQVLLRRSWRSRDISLVSAQFPALGSGVALAFLTAREQLSVSSSRPFDRPDISRGPKHHGALRNMVHPGSGCGRRVPPHARGPVDKCGFGRHMRRPRAQRRGCRPRRCSPKRVRSGAALRRQRSPLSPHPRDDGRQLSRDRMA